MLFVVNSYDVTILNNVLYFILKYLYFPTFFEYSLTIVLAFFLLLYTIFNDQITEKVRIINYVFCSLLIVSYAIFLMLQIDVTVYSKLYTGDSLLCLRYATRGFSLWIVIQLIVKYYNYFVWKRWF